MCLLDIINQGKIIHGIGMLVLALFPLTLIMIRQGTRILTWISTWSWCFGDQRRRQLPGFRTRRTLLTNTQMVTFILWLAFRKWAGTSRTPTFRRRSTRRIEPRWFAGRKRSKRLMNACRILIFISSRRGSLLTAIILAAGSRSLPSSAPRGATAARKRTVPARGGGLCIIAAAVRIIDTRSRYPPFILSERHQVIPVGLFACIIRKYNGVVWHF